MDTVGPIDPSVELAGYPADLHRIEPPRRSQPPSLKFPEPRRPAHSYLTISAIIPLYNGSRFIEDALASILAQTLAPDEIIVVDDGSADNGPDIVRRLALDHPITLISKPNGGQSSARNVGIAHSKGRLIALLDQDDMWYPNHLEELIKPFQQLRDRPLGWVYSNLDEVDINGRMVMPGCLANALRVQHPKRNILGCLYTDMFVLPSASLISREAFDAVGGFDERLSGYEDDDLFLRMFRACYENVYLETGLTKWRIFRGSSSFTIRMGRSRMTYIRKLMDEFPDEPQREIYLTRDLLVPRFFPMLVREYTMALRSGSATRVETTLADLRFLARHRALLGAMVAAMHPVLRHRAIALRLLPVGTAMRPLFRWLLR